MSTLLLDPPVGDLIIPDQQGRSAQVESAEQERVHLSLIVPTYNEGKNVERVVRILSGLLEEPTKGRYELIIVDDDSPDGTWKVAQDLMDEFPKLRVMRRQQERGLSTAVIRGWQAARGEILGVIDGDLQHPPETLVKLLQAIDDGADMAVASRHVEGGGVSNWSVTRRILSRGAQMLGLMILPNVLGRVTDPMSGYFMVRRSAVAYKYLSPVGYKILLEVLGRGDVGTVAEVGYVFQERLEGESKVTWKLYKDYLLHLAKLRSRGRVGRIRQKLQFPLDRFLRFGLVGLSGVFVDMTVFYLLSDPASLGWALSRSKIIAGEVAIINNFLWNDLWTFGDISSHQRGWNPRLRRFIKFNIICLMGLILNVLLLNTFVYLFNVVPLIPKNLIPYVSNLLAIAVVTIWNFWINMKLSWRVTQVK